MRTTHFASKAVAALTLALFFAGLASAALSEAQQYKDALYEKYLESMEKARDNYLDLLHTAKKMKIEKSRWIDSACVRVKEINQFLGDNKDSTCCVKKDSVQVPKKAQ
jgi:hypothetical protein